MKATHIIKHRKTLQNEIYAQVRQVADENVKFLLKKCLVVDEQCRPSAAQIVQFIHHKHSALNIKQLQPYFEHILIKYISNK